MNRAELKEKLCSLGYTMCYTRAQTYLYAFILQNKSETIFFLLRRFGVDFIYHKYLKEFKFDKKGLLHTDAINGYRVRNTFDGADFRIHEYILELAKLFANNKPIPQSCLNDNGYSVFKKKEIYRIKITGTESNYELNQIFDDIPTDYFGNKYISDGMCLTSEGKITDEI